MPGQGNNYALTRKGGVATEQKPEVKPAPPARPAAKPAPKRAASDIVGVKPDVQKKAPAAKVVKRPAGKPKLAPPMPGRKIPNKTKKRTPSPEEQTQQLADSVVSNFTDRLTTEANAKGGSLTVQDLQSLNKEFEQQAHSTRLFS